MAITKKIQFLRNNSIYTGATGSDARAAAIAGMRNAVTGSTTSGDIVDGQAILARYNAAGNASTGDVQTIYGIVHKGVNGKTGVTVYESSELLWAAINECASTGTTITAGDALSGGGALSGDITIRHNTITTTQSSETATTLAHNGTFSAITSVSTDGMGHATGVTTTKFTLPSAADTAVTQTAYDNRPPLPFIIKNTSNSATTADSVSFVTAATVDGQGVITAHRLNATYISGANVSGESFSGGSLTVTGTVSAADVTASTSVSSPTVSGTTVKGVTVSATTYENLPVDPDTAVTQTSYTTANARPILLKNGTGTGTITGSVSFVTAATIDGLGNLSAKTSVSSPSISATTVSGTTVKGATVSAGTYENLPAATSSNNGTVKVVESTGTTSGDTVMSQKAVTEAITSALSDVADALVYQGTVNGSATSPGASLPAANKGDVYKVAQSGCVAGVKVEVGDMFICNTDNTAAGTASTNWDVIQTNVDMANYVQTARTITAGTCLSGGGNLGSDVTISHNAITTTQSSATAGTLAHDGTFSAVTAVATDGNGHTTGVTTTEFTLPSASDTAVTQSGYTTATAVPILTKSTTGTATTTGAVSFVTAATVDGSGNFSAKTSVSSPSVSATTVSGTTIKGATVSATTYANLPVDPDTAVTQSAYTTATARPIVLKNGTGEATVTGGVAFVTAATIDGSGNLSASTSVSSPAISGTTVTASGLATASGFSATSLASTASTDINASILLSNGKNTNTIDCGTY